MEIKKKAKEIHITHSCRSNSKKKKYTKLKISNSIHYKPQKGKFRTANKFFSCYLN